MQSEMNVNETPLVNASSGRLLLLVLSRDLNTSIGGVVTYVRNQKRAMSPLVDWRHMTIGRREGESAVKRIFRVLADPLQLYLQLKREQIKVVQVNTSMKYKPLIRDSVFSWLVARSRDPALMVVFHGWDPEVAASIQKSRIRRWWFKMCFGGAKLVIILSHRFVDEAQALGFPASIVHVLPSMFDDREFGKFRNRPIQKSNVVLFMSRLDPKKGALELAMAFTQGAHGQWPSWNLVIAGDGPQKKSIEEYVRSAGMSDRIAVVGAVVGQRRLELFEKAAVFALPTSDDEGLPISILEAMSAGCAVLTTSVGGLAEIMEEGVHGSILSKVSTQSVHAGLERLICQAEYRDSTQHRCHTLAWSHFSSSEVVGACEQLLLGLYR